MPTSLPVPTPASTRRPGPRRWLEARDAPRGWQITVLRIFGIDAHFDRPAARADVFLPQRQCGAGREGELPAHEIDAVNEFGNGMLDLQARVHFEKVERIIGREQKTRPFPHSYTRRIAPPPRRAAPIRARVSSSSASEGASSTIF